jgi:hypothetical protein
VAKDDNAEVEMTVIHFKTKSNNATLQENVRAIANTLTRALAPPPRVIQTPAQLTSGNGASADGTVQGQLFEADGHEDAIDIDATSVTKKAKKGTARELRTPEVLDLDLTSGDMPLKLFFEQKKPEGDNKRYLAIAYWLKEYRKIVEITMDHAHTCYRSLGWNTPRDASAPLRSMKKQGWMKRGSSPGAYAINHVGEGVVNDMGQAESAS